MRWSELVAVGILQQADQQARRGGPDTGSASLIVTPQLSLDSIPKLLRHNGFVLTGIHLIAVGDFTPVDPVLQNLVQGSAGVGAATRESAAFDILRRREPDSSVWSPFTRCTVHSQRYAKQVNKWKAARRHNSGIGISRPSPAGASGP